MPAAGTSHLLSIRFHRFPGHRLRLVRAREIIGPGERLELHPDDAAPLGLATGDRAAVLFGGRRFAFPVVVTPRVPPGQPALPYDAAFAFTNEIDGLWERGLDRLGVEIRDVRVFRDVYYTHPFGVDARSLQSQRKAKSVSHPRMLAMFLARKYTRAALAEIGEYFGRRSHSTVVSAQKRVEGWLAAGMPVELAERVCGIDDAIRQVEKRLRVG